MTLKRRLAEYASRLGLGAALRGVQRARGGGSAFIVGYHRVSEALSCFGLAVSPQLFEEQVALLGRIARIVPLQALVERLRRPERLQEDLVAITFDDGYLDNLEIAEPILRRHRAPATVFVTVDFAEGDTTPYWDRLDRVLAGFRLRKARPEQWREVGDPTLDDAICNAIAASEDDAAMDALDRALRALTRQDREEVRHR